MWLVGCTPTQHASSSQNAAPQATAPTLPTAPQQTLQSAVQQKTQQEQRVQVLIEQVEKAYSNGQTDYRRGDLPAAIIVSGLLDTQTAGGAERVECDGWAAEVIRP